MKRFFSLAAILALVASGCTLISYTDAAGCQVQVKSYWADPNMVPSVDVTAQTAGCTVQVIDRSLYGDFGGPAENYWRDYEASPTGTSVTFRNQPDGFEDDRVIAVLSTDGTSCEETTFWISPGTDVEKASGPDDVSAYLPGCVYRTEIGFYDSNQSPWDASIHDSWMPFN